MDDDALANGDGLSWATAFAGLQEALAVAVSGDRIYVAEGIYFPDQGTQSRIETFFIADGVEVLGGYAGIGAIHPDERNIELFPVILSGDISAFPSGRSFHVVTIAAGAGASTVLDGLTITHGSATGLGVDEDRGAGLWNADGSPTIRNCRFTDHESSGDGASVWSTGDPTFLSCTFRDNDAGKSAGGGKGGAVLSVGNPIFKKCRFDGNQSGEGGAVHSTGNAIFEACAFAENSASQLFQSSTGGAVFSDGAPRFKNCVFLDNLAWESHGFGDGGALYSIGPARLEQCTFEGNAAPDGLGGAIYADGNHTIVDSRFELNRGSYGGGLYQDGDSDLANCFFLSNTAPLPRVGGGFGGAIYNKGDLTITHCTIVGNSTEDFGFAGGIYNESGSPAITNTILWDNTDYFGIGEDAQYWGTPGDINFCCVQGWTGILGGQDNFDAPPEFVDQSTGDYHLFASSPCIDAGTRNAPAMPLKDSEGDPRNFEQSPDLGADEFHRHLYVIGDFTPGGAITIRVTASPGIEQVAVAVSQSIFDNPVATQAGPLFLRPPIKFRLLGPVPPSGVVSTTMLLPTAIEMPNPIPLQALAGTQGTNLFRIFWE